jgi:hypothetical protein
LNLNLPEANALCKECPQRYDGLLNDLQKIIEDKKEVLFL